MSLEPLQYATPSAPKNPANRRFAIALIVLCFFLLIGIADLVFIRYLSSVSESAKLVFLLTACIEGLYVAAIVTTLALRVWSPRAGRVATVALNIVLLFMFPFGTAIGIYGLRKVDKIVAQESRTAQDPPDS